MGRAVVALCGTELEVLCWAGRYVVRIQANKAAKNSVTITKTHSTIPQICKELLYCLQQMSSVSSFCWYSIPLPSTIAFYTSSNTTISIAADNLPAFAKFLYCLVHFLWHVISQYSDCKKCWIVTSKYSLPTLGVKWPGKGMVIIRTDKWRPLTLPSPDVSEKGTAQSQKTLILPVSMNFHHHYYIHTFMQFCWVE